MEKWNELIHCIPRVQRKVYNESKFGIRQRVEGDDDLDSVRYGRAINPFPRQGELTVLFAGYNQTAPFHQVGPHALDYHLVHLVISGKGSFAWRGQWRELGAGDCFFIYPDELTTYVSDEEDPWRYSWIGFRGTEAYKLLKEAGVSPDQPVVEHSGEPEHDLQLQTLFIQLRDTLQSGKAGSDLRAGAYLRHIFGELFDRIAVPPEEAGEHPSVAELERRMELAIRWLALQYHRPVSIEELAKETGYHRAYLTRMFRKKTGLSPTRYLLQLRMERAILLLREPLTIAEIASSVGYTDPLNFSKQFKKWHGRSPSELRMDLFQSKK
ncbi:MAG: transcriptional regulator, AraC family [Paenibacillus sp.]|nr:transcriptional regulator, AraC family [Paenibacillus sp.]